MRIILIVVFVLFAGFLLTHGLTLVSNSNTLWEKAKAECVKFGYPVLSHIEWQDGQPRAQCQKWSVGLADLTVEQ